MWHFMPISYVIINTGIKYRLTFYVKQRQNRFGYIMFLSIKLYIFAV